MSDSDLFIKLNNIIVLTENLLLHLYNIKNNIQNNNVTEPNSENENNTIIQNQNDTSNYIYGC